LSGFAAPEVSDTVITIGLGLRHQLVMKLQTRA